MKISILKIALASLILFVLATLGYQKTRLQKQQAFEKMPKLQRIDKAIEQEFEATKDPALNEVPRQRLMAAKAYADRLRNNPSQRAAISGISWDERGPNNVSGRTRAILVDAADATGNTLFAGGVGGGLWRTTNALAATPTWTNIGDQFGNLAIASMYQDPSNNSVMYFGTGEGWFNADAIRGLGIWKSTDGGATWNQLSSTNNSTFHYVQKIVIDGSGNVLACTRDGGIQRSTNGGSSWTKVLGSGAGASTNRAADIEIAANGDFYASMGIFSTDGIYKSSNGTSWTKLSGGLPASGYNRIELACAPSDQNRVYALFAGNNYDVSGIYRTDNGGSSWTSLPVPGAFGMSNFSRGQAWYDLIAAVHPTNSNRVFIGGIDILVSDNAGSSWTQISQWYGGGGFQYAHADQHGMIFQPNNANVMYYANDGGVYRTTNAGAGTPTISFISNGYNVTQYYHADIHPGYGVNEYLAGAQDNGTQRYTSPGINNTVEVTGGDGAFSHIDQDNPAIQISAYVYNQYRVTSNGWGSYSTINYSSSTGRFINPTDYDSDQNVLYGANNGNSYFRMTGVGSSNTTGAQSMTAFGGAEASHVRVSPNVTNRVYFGLDNGDVVRVDNAHTGSAAGTVIRAGSGYVSCVEVEEGNEDHILVTYSNYGVNSIFETTNGGTSWTSVEGNLPDMPIRWVIFIPGSSDSAMVATELGTWTTDNLNGTSTVWGPSNTNFANVRVDAIVSRASDQQIIAATHGRGLYSTDAFNVPPPPVTCNATVTSFPYGESFESGLGDWVLAPGQFLWTRNSGGTPSSGTGPAGAADGTFYMYMEVSSPNYPSLNAYFEGPCFDLTSASDADISFQYHMLGAPGTLRLQLSTDNGATWPTDVWTISGDQGTNWQTANVDLSAYAGSIIKLRFHGTSGTTWQGDICVDDINVTTAGAAPLVVAIPTSSDVSCNGGNDGSATASATGGTSPYSYSWSSGSSSATASGLSAASYTVTVTDASSATASASVSISQPTAISASASATDAACNGGNGSVDLTVSGGTAPYSYSWSNGVTTQDLASVAAGTYTVTITDNNGCTAGAGATVNEPSALALSISGTDESGPGANDGAADLTVSGGTTPYAYNWSNGASTQDISGLSGGIYTVTVTDANNCTADESVVINTLAGPLTVSISGSSDVSCNGGADGDATAAAAGGTAPYSYAWSSGSTSATATGLAAGSYTVTVTDAASGTASTSVIISEPTALSASASATDALCNGGNGSVDLSVSGGTAPFSYNWSNGANTEDLAAVAAGTYNVTVTDANGCVTNSGPTVNEPTALSASASATAAACNGGNGSVDLSVSGGTAPYSYNWSNGATTEDLAAVAAGTYNVTVTDANGCEESTGATVNEPSALNLSISGTDESAPGAADGAADLTVSGGTPTYTYSWSNGATTEDISGLSGGTYTVTVTDVNNCTASSSVVINTTIPTSLNAEYGIVSSVGNNWQTVNLQNTYTSMVVVATPVLPDQSTLPVVSRIQNASGSSFQLRIQNPGGTAATSYDVHYFVVEEGVYTQAADGVTMEAVKFTSTVTAENNNWAFEPQTYANSYTNPVVLGQVMSYNDADWSVFWASENGNRVNPPAASSLAAGKHVAEDTDITRANETVGYLVFESGAGSAGGVNFVAGLGADIVEGPTNTIGYNYTLSGLTDASVAVLSAAAMDGGNGGWPVLFGTNPVSATQMTLVFDEDQIADSERTHINEQVAYLVFENPTDPCAAFAANASASDISCNGSTDGSASATPVNGTAPFTYSWSNGGTTASISGLSAGTYTVTITDANSCTASASGTVSEPTALSASATATDASCNGTTDGSVNLTVLGGTAPYTYNWSNGSSTEDISGLAAGTYSVTVTDANGCAAGAVATVNEPAALAASAAATDASCNGYTDGAVDLTVSGGTTPYSYSWSNGSTTEDISGLAAGSYNVTVTDANGCVANAAASVGQPAGINLSTAVTDASCNGDTDGAVNLTVTNGASPYAYSWSNGATTEDISGLGAGSYNVTVTDASGCTAVTAASVGEPIALGLSASVTDESSAGANDGAINLTISGGTAAYSVSWTGPSGYTASTEDISGLVPGTYNVAVLDANGCSINDSYTVNAGSSTPTITIEEGVATNVGDSWVTINTVNTYTNMVVVATPVINSNTDPSIATRIQNAGTNSFQLRVQNPSGNALSGIAVHYVVVEAGVYDQATYGVTMEAVRTTSTTTAGKNTWVFEARSYGNTYTNPVVIGQVMTYNDANWSVFWASSSSRTSPPTASSFSAGKMVGEDPNGTRVNEDIGYIVIESGSGSIGSLSYDAGVGADNVRGLGNSASGYNYGTSIANISSAHVSAAGMDGADGGWPSLFGTTPVSTSQITISFHEDVLNDSERNHTTEQVAYVVFGAAASGNQPLSDIPVEDLDVDPDAPQAGDMDQGFDLFPNPTNGKLFIVMESAEALMAQLKIYDMKGRLVGAKEVELAEGSQKMELDVSNLSEGVYLLHFNTSQSTYTKRFIKKQ